MIEAKTDLCIQGTGCQKKLIEHSQLHGSHNEENCA